MKRARIVLFFLTVTLLNAVGCQATQKASHQVGKAAVAVPILLVEGLVDGIFDSDESGMERVHRERREREWKQYWRDNPTENPAMHEAFRDDYE